jgi:hypothetical protein
LSTSGCSKNEYEQVRNPYARLAARLLRSMNAPSLLPSGLPGTASYRNGIEPMCWLTAWSRRTLAPDAWLRQALVVLRRDLAGRRFEERLALVRGSLTAAASRDWPADQRQSCRARG